MTMVVTNGGTGALSGPFPLTLFLLDSYSASPGPLEDLGYGPAVEPGFGEEIGCVVVFLAVIGIAVKFGHRRLRGLRPGHPVEGTPSDPPGHSPGNRFPSPPGRHLQGPPMRRREPSRHYGLPPVPAMLPRCERGQPWRR